MMHKWLAMGLVAAATLVPMKSVTMTEVEEEEEAGLPRAAAISNLSFRQVQIVLR